MTKTRKVYYNHKQASFLASRHRFKDLIGGMGSGKTATIALHNFQKLKELPRAKSGLAALTFNQLLNNCIPNMTKIWANCGIYEHTKDEDGHYVIGVRPPLWWAKPLDAPRKYEYVISFLNGYCIQLLSLDRPDTIRGLNLDALDCDEKAWIKEDDFNKILTTRVRGNIGEFDSSLHGSICGFSSMPWHASGQWILKAEEFAQQYPDEQFFIESSCLDNEAVLGPNYLRDAERRLPKLVVQVDYLNKRIKKVPNAFYSSFNEDLHTTYKTFDYQQTESGLFVAGHLDKVTNLPLELSFDFNASITSCIVAQEHPKEIRLINEFFVKESETNLLDELLNKFIDEYKSHAIKDIFIYGDRNGRNKKVDDNRSFYDKIVDRLILEGFNPILMVRESYPSHKDKYILINTLFSESEKYTPRIRINKNRCKFLIVSIQGANMINDFQKDKRSEESKSLDQERATHLSDCFDYLIFTKYSYLIDSSEGEVYETRVA
jgi:hypothetical protein